jgi:hypothetical protein
VRESDELSDEADDDPFADSLSAAQSSSVPQTPAWSAPGWAPTTPAPGRAPAQLPQAAAAAAAAEAAVPSPRQDAAALAPPASAPAVAGGGAPGMTHAVLVQRRGVLTKSMKEQLALLKKVVESATKILPTIATFPRAQGFRQCLPVDACAPC